jgi:putative PIN family toxin of toxin-antitoxin system
VKLVVDTNVLIAGLATEGLCRDIVKRCLPGFELFASRALLEELVETLREKFRLSPDDLPLLEIYENHATVITPQPPTKLGCRDADDDEVLATALEAKADIILTGDKDLLVLKEFRGIKILSPRQFVEWMDAQK